MNLELLFRGWQLTGNKTYYDMAVSHTNRTIKEHIRSDNSSNQVVEFNSTTGKNQKILSFKTFLYHFLHFLHPLNWNSGEVIRKRTQQGWSDSSCWSRSQAWLVAGLTIAYRYIWIEWPKHQINFFQHEKFIWDTQNSTIYYMQPNVCPNTLSNIYPKTTFHFLISLYLKMRCIIFRKILLLQPSLPQDFSNCIHSLIIHFIWSQPQKWLIRCSITIELTANLNINYLQFLWTEPFITRATSIKRCLSATIILWNVFNIICSFMSFVYLKNLMINVENNHLF